MPEAAPPPVRRTKALGVRLVEAKTGLLRANSFRPADERSNWLESGEVRSSHLARMMYVLYIVENPMVRTQIYLTSAEQKGLRTLSKRTGRSQSDLIREAVDAYLVHDKASDRAASLRQARGLWRDRNDLPDFAALRKSFDRVV